MATRKRAKKQTLAEFRAWLSGVEELQPENWAPNADQWKLIRGKIDGITEPKPRTTPTNNNQQHVPQHQNPPHSAAVAHIPPPPPPVGGVPPGPVAPPTPAASTILPPAKPIDIVEVAKPNLDTSDGNYESGFV